jgi:hypothetical protein
VQINYFNSSKRIRDVSPVNLNVVVLEGTCVIASKASPHRTDNTLSRRRPSVEHSQLVTDGAGKATECLVFALVEICCPSLQQQPPPPLTVSIPKHWTGFSHSPCRVKLVRWRALYTADLWDGVNLRAQVRGPVPSWFVRRGQLESSGEGPCTQLSWQTGSTWELRWGALYPAKLTDGVNLRAQVRGPVPRWAERRGQLESAGEGPCTQLICETGLTWELRWGALYPAELTDGVNLRAQVRGPVPSWSDRQGQLESSVRGPVSSRTGKRVTQPKL